MFYSLLWSFLNIMYSHCRNLLTVPQELMQQISQPALEKEPHSWESSMSLRVQSTQICGMHGSCTTNRNNDFGNVLCIWVLGPLGCLLETRAVSLNRSLVKFMSRASNEDASSGRGSPSSPVPYSRSWGRPRNSSPLYR